MVASTNATDLRRQLDVAGVIYSAWNCARRHGDDRPGRAAIMVCGALDGCAGEQVLGYADGVFVGTEQVLHRLRQHRRWRVPRDRTSQPADQHVHCGVADRSTAGPGSAPVLDRHSSNSPIPPPGARRLVQSTTVAAASRRARGLHGDPGERRIPSLPWRWPGRWRTRRRRRHSAGCDRRTIRPTAIDADARTDDRQERARIDMRTTTQLAAALSAVGPPCGRALRHRRGSPGVRRRNRPACGLRRGGPAPEAS